MKRGEDLRKGRNIIRIVILTVLGKGDCYGYQLTQMVKEHSGGRLTIPEGSLYPTLYSLEDEGYITSEKKVLDRDRERIYYHIEPTGREYLKNLINEYYKLNETIDEFIKHSSLNEGKEE